LRSGPRRASAMSNEKAKPAVLVTGARGGIGRALCTILVKQGWRVAAVGRDASSMGDIPAELRIAADTTTVEGAREAVARSSETFGRAPSGLAHCVGNTLIAPMHRTTLDQWHEVLRVNLESAWCMLSTWVGALQSGGSPGSAVFVSSVVARIGVANHEAIAAAKAGIEGLVRSAAATYAPQKLRINAVAPGMTETPLTAGLLSVPVVREGAAKQYPLGGIQTATSVAEAMAWLLSDAADRITGQCLAIDGGFSTIRPMVR
jgi:NAD(P)-dependent dehydrogenase (short-subunit alcohol dehydrogenase family)